MGLSMRKGSEREWGGGGSGWGDGEHRGRVHSGGGEETTGHREGRRNSKLMFPNGCFSSIWGIYYM